MKIPQQRKSRAPEIAGVLPRPRLIAALDGFEGHLLTWIHAPPGYGKSTALANYQLVCDRAAIWYRFDQTDAALAGLFAGLRLALTVRRGGSKRLPRYHEDAGHDLVTFAHSFFRAAACQLPARTLILFDDVHLLAESPPALAVFLIAVEELGAAHRVVAASREDLSDAILSQIGAQRVGWLDAKALAFTADEVEAICHDNGLADPALRERIFTIAGGWAAGSVLLIDQARRFGQLPGELGSDGFEVMFGYFLSRCFDGLPKTMQQTLLETSLFPTFTPGMAVTLCRRSAAKRELALLWRRNFFIERRLAPRISYRYHDLFRACLIDRLGMTRTPADLRLLRARAARILAAAKETEAAIDLCIGGGLHRLALSLLTRAAPRLLRSGRSHFIREKFDALPKALLQHATLARFWLGIACQVAESGRAVVLLEGAYNDFAAKGNLRWQIKAVSALVHSRIYSARPMVELRGWIPIIERLRLRIGERHARHHVTLLAALVYASFYAKPDHPRLRAWALELDAQLGSISNPTDRLLGALHLVTYYTWSGDLDHARSLVQRIGPLNDNAAQSPALRLYAQSRVVLLYAFDADYARARDVLHAMRLAVATDGLELMVLGCVFFEAMVGWLEGDLTAAAQAIGQIGRWAGERNLNLAVNVHQVLALNCISSHRPELARAHSMMAIRAADTSGIQWFRAVARLTRAYAECAGGRFDLARRLLRVVRVLISRTPYEHFEVECRMIEVSIELQRQGVTPTVLKHLADTLYQAERSSPIFAFRAVPLGLPYLLNVARRHAIAPNYSRRLEQKFWPDRRMPECGIVAAPRPRVEVFLLGKFQVRVDGEVLAFGKKTPRRSLSVIAACAAYGTGGHPCTRSSMTFGPNRRDQRSNSLFAQPCGACARSYQWSTRLSIATACSQLIGTWYGSMQLRPSMRSNK